MEKGMGTQVILLFYSFFSVSVPRAYKHQEKKSLVIFTTSTPEHQHGAWQQKTFNKSFLNKRLSDFSGFSVLLAKGDSSSLQSIT